MLALVHTEHVLRLQGIDHIRGRHGGQITDVLDTEARRGGRILATTAGSCRRTSSGAISALVLDDEGGDGLAPVVAVAEQAEITERFFGTAELSLALAEFVGEGHKKVAVAFALVLREGENAGHVEAVGAVLFFAKIAD